MEIKDLLSKNNTLFLDTSVFIYYIEKNNKYFDIVNQIFSTQNQNIKFITSTITLLEVLTQPLKLGNHDLAKQYSDIILHSANILVLPVDSEIAFKSAQLRAKYNFIKTPDSIQLAISEISKSNIFITNDTKLKNITEISITLLDELV